jgi:hypothetical protein
MSLHEGLHKHAFWLYGVIVALAIQRALMTVVPHIFDAFQTPSETTNDLFLEGMRLLIFLVIILRFFLGSVSFFQDAYEAADADTTYARKNYALDYVFGLVHFLFFFASCMAIEAKSSRRLFPFFLGVVLFYDLPWYFACRKYDTNRRMKLWTAVNLLTLVVAWASYASARAYGTDTTIAQEWAFVPILAFSVVDIAEIIGRKDIFKKWLGKLIDLKEKPPAQERFEFEGDDIPPPPDVDSVNT